MRTSVIGRPFIELPSVDSTNKYAADLLAEKKATHGTVILAHEQTHGRGQRGHVWKSASGLDIAMSVVLLPQALRASDQFALSVATALAVHDVVADAMRAAVSRDRESVRIKWPNDVLIDRRKVAGILIKNEIVGGLVASCIVGIGINVNSSELDAEFNATSLRMEVGIPLERMDLVHMLCERLDHHLDLVPGRSDDLRSRFTELLWSRNRYADFELDGQPVSGRPVGVEADGRLLLEDENGHVEAYGTERLRFAPR